jgi:hypothetical protein
VVVLLSSVWFGTWNWRFEVEVEICFGEKVLKVKMWRKVEIPKNPSVLRSWTCSYMDLCSTALGDSRVAREEANGFGVVKLLLRPDCLGR